MLRRHEGDSNKAKTTILKSRLWSWVEVEDSKLNSKDALSGWRVITELATTPQKYREIYLSSRSSRLKPSSFLQLHGRLAWLEKPQAKPSSRQAGRLVDKYDIRSIKTVEVHAVDIINVNEQARIGTVVKESSNLGQETRCTRVRFNVQKLVRPMHPPDVFSAEELR
jgi:hypothetical protein